MPYEQIPRNERTRAGFKIPIKLEILMFPDEFFQQAGTHLGSSPYDPADEETEKEADRLSWIASHYIVMRANLCHDDHPSASKKIEVIDAALRNYELFREAHNYPH